ncbi:MAG TPA: universal stress protein [Cyclobacteriaceae bacterium]|nr:universal stress protein [Cyclobacteriaceae bacterium]HRJ82811.1 universal stress protein [Cyclobacteriaceae bacterium]
MKRILVPTDFSKEAQTAAEVASGIARKSGAQLILLHVIEEGSKDSVRITGEIAYADMEDKLFTLKLIERSRKQMAKFAESAFFSGIKVIPELRMGSPYHGIRTIITEQKVDLVVMGTAGKTDLAEMIIGSNTEKVVRHAHCPVLTIQRKPLRSDFKNIVYATSMSKDEEVFSRIVKRAQEMYDATVHLVRINTPGNFQRDAVVKKYMNDFAKKLQLKNYTVNVFNDITEEEGIIYFAESINADMIAMATHGRTGFAHVLAGSIAEDVVNHSKRPVLTFVVKHKKK